MTDYTFLPWVRRGISRSLTGAVNPSGPARPALNVSVAVNGTPVTVPVALHGPGDATAIDPAAVVRVDPAPDVIDAEPSLFAAIELVPADLPWLLTPCGPDANGRLLPWLALVVVPQDAGQIGPGPDGGTRPAEVGCAELPPPSEAWAWAHSQLLGALSGPVADSLDAAPGLWRARILSPRRLDPGQSYLAALVPVFAAGAAAALGAAAPAQPLAFAWDPAASGTVTLPTYHHWTFATSADADFETLARRIVGRVLQDGVGHLAVDFTQPGTGLHPASDGLWVEGALAQIGDALPALPAQAAALSSDIATLVARTESSLVVGPPLYGPVPTTSAASGGSGSPSAIPATGWQHEVNVDPRVRAITGVGAAVVRRDQEALVASAWQQVGDMRVANRALGWLTLANATGRGFYRRHFAQASVDTLTQWSAPAQTQIQMNPQTPTTLAAMVSTTALSSAALGSGARRLLRSTGPLITRALVGAMAAGPQTTHPSGTNTPAPTPTPSPTGGEVQPGGGVQPGGAFHPAGGGVHVDPGHLVFSGGVITVGPSNVNDTPPGLVTVERVRQLMGNPAGLAAFGLDGLTSAVVQQRSLLQIATSLVNESGGPSGLPPNSHHTFAAAAQPTQDAVLAQLTAARRPPPVVTTTTLDPSQLLEALDPAPRFTAIGIQRVTAPSQAGNRAPLDPVLIAPTYSQPAVDSLIAVAPELLLPGLDTVLTNTATLATTNQRFVEAFLLGMNHELERELRWRGFPTVPGSTAFRRFWDTPPGQVDIAEVADWSANSALGSHGADPGADTVLVIRGDLVRRFPDVAVTAIPLDAHGAPVTDPSAEISPVLRGAMYPDVLYAGFGFPPTQAAGHAYVLTQQPGAPRFGLDDESPLDAASVVQRNDLAWSQLGSRAQFATAAGPLAGKTISDGSASAVWGRNSADMAWLTRQAPVRLTLLSANLLPAVSTS